MDAKFNTSIEGGRPPCLETCMCVYVCVCVCACVYIHTRTRTRIHIHTYTYTHVHASHTNTHTHHIHTYTLMCVLGRILLDHVPESCWANTRKRHLYQEGKGRTAQFQSIYSNSWLSRTFAMSNKFSGPLRVQDSGC